MKWHDCSCSYQTGKRTLYNCTCFVEISTPPFACTCTFSYIYEAVCSKFFVELWSSDPNGFPVPDGCFFDIDNTKAGVSINQLHIIFSPNNNMNSNTQYMAVLNVNVLSAFQKELSLNYN